MVDIYSYSYNSCSGMRENNNGTEQKTSFLIMKVDHDRLVKVLGSTNPTRKNIDGEDQGGNEVKDWHGQTNCIQRECQKENRKITNKLTNVHIYFLFK